MKELDQEHFALFMNCHQNPSHKDNFCVKATCQNHAKINNIIMHCNCVSIHALVVIRTLVHALVVTEYIIVSIVTPHSQSDNLIINRF